MKILATVLSATAALVLLSGCVNDRYDRNGYGRDGYRDGYGNNGYYDRNNDRNRYDRDRFNNRDRDDDRYRDRD